MKNFIKTLRIIFLISFALIMINSFIYSFDRIIVITAFVTAIASISVVLLMKLKVNYLDS